MFIIHVLCKPVLSEPKTNVLITQWWKAVIHFRVWDCRFEYTCYFSAVWLCEYVKCAI